jgi:hypothetical protein
VTAGGPVTIAPGSTAAPAKRSGGAAAEGLAVQEGHGFLTKGPRRQRGEGKAGCVFWILLLVAGVVVGLKIIPIEIAKGQLKDHIAELAQFQPHRTADFYQTAIFGRAQELGLPIEKKAIKVNKGPERIIVDIDVRVPVDLIVTTIQYRVRIFIDRDIFII